MSKDYYNILGVSRTASADEIKSAFRKKAMEHHPDRGGDAQKFKEFNEAYQVLGTPDARAQYDQYGSTFDEMRNRGFSGFQGSQGMNFDFGDLGDIFGGLGEMFGFSERGRSGNGRGGEARGNDLEMRTAIDFMEMVTGATRDIEIEKTGRCAHCKGDGAEPGSAWNNCLNCGSSGRVTQMRQSILGSMQTVVACGHCHGKGKRPEKVCTDCKGKGTNRVKRRLSVRIPAGISDGEVIRLRGEGEEVARGNAGDFFIHVNVRPHAEFERRDQNIWTRQEVSFKIAALGGQIDVKTVDGPVTLKIPVGTQSGQIMKLKGKGIPHVHGSGPASSVSRGDHYIEIIIVVPKHLSRKQKQILEEFED